MLPPAQAQLESTSSYDSSDFWDINASTGYDPMISPTFIESVSNSMGFSTLDKDYCSSLHSILKVSYVISCANLITNTQSDGARVTEGTATALHLSDWSYVCNPQRKPCDCRFMPGWLSDDGWYPHLPWRGICAHIRTKSMSSFLFHLYLHNSGLTSQTFILLPGSCSLIPTVCTILNCMSMLR